MINIAIKPLSINVSFQGKRFKTATCKDYEKELWYLLPTRGVEIPTGKIHIKYEFGFSNKNADLLNPEKVLTDLIAKKYNFNDRQVYKMTLKKVDTKKGREYIKFNILPLLRLSRE